MQTAGTGTRVIHFVVDTIIAFLISLLAHSIWKFQVFYYRYPWIPFWYFFYGFMAVYPFFCEWITGGRTIGKYLTMCRAVSNTGRQISPGVLLIRSIARMAFVIDPFFLPFTAGKTLHDLVSNTKVVTND